MDILFLLGNRYMNFVEINILGIIKISENRRTILGLTHAIFNRFPKKSFKRTMPPERVGGDGTFFLRSPLSEAVKKRDHA